MKKENVLLELLIGIILLGVAIQMVCLIVSKDYLYDAVGLWGGIAVAYFMAIHMKRSIEETLDIGVEGAEKHARNAYITRTLITLAVIGIIFYFGLGNPITLVVGIFSLKLAAYLQPQMHKLFLKFRKSE